MGRGFSRIERIGADFLKRKVRLNLGVLFHPFSFRLHPCRSRPRPILVNQSFQAGIRAARANVVPALILQAVALALGLSYALVPAARESFEQLALYKHSIGIPFAMVSTAIWAGLVPLLLQRFQRGAQHEPLSRLPFFLIFWALMGAIIDAFYNWQALVWGDNAQPLTIFIKTACDMFAFTPILMPCVLATYAWKDGGFRGEAVREFFRRGWYFQRVVPALITGWMVWIPALCVIYALPLALQLPIQNVVEGLWALFLMVLSKPEPQLALK